MRLQVAGLLAVKLAGSVALKLLGIARGAALVLFEVARAHDGTADTPPTLLQLGGYGASLGGFVAYTWLRVGTLGTTAGTSTAGRKPKKE
jgi:hypothetical protein